MSAPVICIGAMMVDELFFCDEKAIAGTSNPAVLQRSAGGVVRNIAHQLALLDIPVKLLSILGNDADGDWLLNDCRQNEIGVDAVSQVDEPTGKYASVLNAGGSLFVAACADSCIRHLDPVFLGRHSGLLATASLIIADTNISEEALVWLVVFSKKNNLRLIIEPVSVAKARKLSAIDLSGVYMITPNEDELASLCCEQHETQRECLKELFSRNVKNIWIRKGKNGSAIHSESSSKELDVPRVSITDSTGAGDAALAGWAAAYLMGLEPLNCLKAGHALAMEVLQVKGAVAKGITREKLINAMQKYYPDEQ